MSSDALQTLTLKSARFRQEREQTWKELEDVLRKVERRGTKALSRDELLALPKLYRAGLSSLSVARATSLDQGVIRYLESLCERAYYALYGARTPIWKRALRYLTHGWPSAVREIWPELLVATAIFTLAAIIGLSFTLSDPEWYYAFMPGGEMDPRNPTASRETLLETIYQTDEAKEESGLAAFAAFLFSNNSRVAILAFALGFAFGLPTIVLLVYNGLSIGAFIAVHVNKELGYEIGGWLSVHGTTELFAIVLAGAGGLRIGRAVAFPGRLSRLQSATASGDVAARVLGGVVIMMFIAGLLEAFPRQLVDSDLIRYGIGWTLFVFWIFYFFVRRSEPALDTSS